jgi:hypothetical protein
MLPNKPRGVRRVDDRCVLSGICWVLRSNAPWRDLPAADGPRTLNDIDNTEGALRSRADLIGESDYRKRLDDMMAAVEALVAAEVQSLPGNIQHVLGARGGRGSSLAGRLTSFCRKLLTPGD